MLSFQVKYSLVTGAVETALFDPRYASEQLPKDLSPLLYSWTWGHNRVGQYVSNFRFFNTFIICGSSFASKSPET